MTTQTFNETVETFVDGSEEYRTYTVRSIGAGDRFLEVVWTKWMNQFGRRLLVSSGAEIHVGEAAIRSNIKASLLDAYLDVVEPLA